MTEIEEKLKLKIYTKEIVINNKTKYMIVTKFNNLERLHAVDIGDGIGLSSGYYYCLMKILGGKFISINLNGIWYFENKEDCDKALIKVLEIHDSINNMIYSNMREE